MTVLSPKICYQVISLVLICFLLADASFGQVDSPSSALQNFQQAQQALGESWNALVAQGATVEQVRAWQTQNATQLATLQQLAQQLATASAAASAGQPMALISEVEVPEDATPEMASFLTTRADLWNRMAQLHNQQVPDAPLVFRQQNGAEIQSLQQQAQVVAAQAAQVALPMPPPLQIPSNATPQMTSYLTAHDQLMRSQIELQNQYIGSDPAVKQAAMQQWYQQNAANVQQLQQLAQNLSTASSN